MITGFAQLNESVMAVGARADDIEIHAVGTLEKFHHQGCLVIYVMTTNNGAGRVARLNPDDPTGRRPLQDEPGPKAMQARRRQECERAAAESGTSPILTPGEDPAAVAEMAEFFLQQDPECVLTHGVAQENPEHFGTCLLVTKGYWQAVARGFKGALSHCREHHACSGEFNSGWETFIDYTTWFDRKMELIGLHSCQMPHAHQPVFGHRLVGREFGKACGCGAAEPFTWVNRSSHRPALGSGHEA